MRSKYEFLVGDKVKANGRSMYDGRKGIILRIMKDKNNDLNDDIYIRFPYGNVVVMAPDMIENIG